MQESHFHCVLIIVSCVLFHQNRSHNWLLLHLLSCSKLYIPLCLCDQIATGCWCGESRCWRWPATRCWQQTWWWSPWPRRKLPGAGCPPTSLRARPLRRSLPSSSRLAGSLHLDLISCIFVTDISQSSSLEPPSLSVLLIVQSAYLAALRGIKETALVVLGYLESALCF